MKFTKNSDIESGKWYLFTESLDYGRNVHIVEIDSCSIISDVDEPTKYIGSGTLIKIVSVNSTSISSVNGTDVNNLEFYESTDSDINEMQYRLTIGIIGIYELDEGEVLGFIAETL